MLVKIDSFQTLPLPEGVTAGPFFVVFNKMSDTYGDNPTEVAQGAFDPAESPAGIIFNVTEPGVYFATCQRMTSTGAGLGPVVQSNMVTVQMYDAPLNITLSIAH